MLLAVFFISHSGIFRFPEHFFLPVLCRRPPCFFPVTPIFYPESFAFYGCCLPCFFQPYRYFWVSGAFFLPVLCRLLPCFSPVIPIFIRNLLRFTDAACCFFISHSGIFRFLKHFFLPVLCRRLPCFFLSSRFSSGIFCVLRMLPVVFFPAISVFLGFRSVFSAGLVQAPAVFFPRHPDFLSGIFCILRMLPTVFFPAIPAFWGSRSILFCRSCAGACRLFSPSSRFSSEIFHILRMLPAVFLSAIPVFFGSRSIFFCQSCTGACRVFSRHPNFHLKSFTFCGCRLPCFFQPYRYFFPFSAFPAYGKSPAFLLPCGFFARTRRARIRTRVIKYGVACGRFFSFFRKTCRKTYLKHSDL